MKFIMFENYLELCTVEAKKIAAIMKNKPDSLICLAAGHSSLGIFQGLVKQYESSALDFSRCRFVAMDEWRGMTQQTPGSCGDLLVKEFISKVNFSLENVCYVNGCAQDLELECQRISHFIYKNGGMDYLLLGVGMNGHLALNEPGVDFELGVHVTELDEVTKKVGTKYFKDTPDLTGGITIGIADIKKAKSITLCVNGERKSTILREIMTQPVSSKIPATVLKELPNASILCDIPAASELFAL